MFLAFVAAVRDIGLEVFAVSGFKFLQDGGFVDDAGATVVSECAEKNGALAVSGVNRAELSEIFTKESVCLCLSQLNSSAIWLSRLDLMTVANVGPVLRLVECIEFLDYQNCPFKERLVHNTSFSGKRRRSDRDGHYRR